MGKKNKHKKRKRTAIVNDKDDDDEPESSSTIPNKLVGKSQDKEDVSLPVAVATASPEVDPPSATKKRKKRKRKKQTTNDETTEDKKEVDRQVKENEESPGVPESSSNTPSFPFPTDSDDHCESPIQAYEHVVTLLKVLCGKSDKMLYDPYYCDGGVKRNLNNLGFANVYNVKEDCYKVWQQSPQQLPSFDVLVTNPPYSGDHIERLMRFLSSSSFGNRPWLLLLPNWVHKKDYYLQATKHIRPFYIVPHKRYVYEPPKNFRQAKKSDVHKKSSPFVSMWYVWGGTDAVNEKLIRQFLQSGHAQECDLARSKSALRDLRRKKR